MGAHRLDDDTWIEFVDTAGQEDFKCIRTQVYHGADLYLILCTADSHPTLDNVKWVFLYRHGILQTRVWEGKTSGKFCSSHSPQNCTMLYQSQRTSLPEQAVPTFPKALDSMIRIWTRLVVYNGWFQGSVGRRGSEAQAKAASHEQVKHCFDLASKSIYLNWGGSRTTVWLSGEIYMWRGFQ